MTQSESPGARLADGREPPRIRIRECVGSDIPAFFRHQSEPAGQEMAAFSSKLPPERAAFDARWIRILADPTIIKRTILLERSGLPAEIAGHVASFLRPPMTPFTVETREVTYWLGRAYWGRGIATAALRMFLTDDATRPLYGRAARDNVASLRVLEKCGFTLVSHVRSFAEARGEEIDEAVLKLA